MFFWGGWFLVFSILICRHYFYIDKIYHFDRYLRECLLDHLFNCLCYLLSFVVAIHVLYAWLYLPIFMSMVWVLLYTESHSPLGDFKYIIVFSLGTFMSLYFKQTFASSRIYFCVNFEKGIQLNFFQIANQWCVLYELSFAHWFQMPTLSYIKFPYISGAIA